LIVPAFLAGQSRGGYVFQASEIRKVSVELAGDSTAWPVVVALASRKVESNEFSLPPASLVKLKNVSKSSASVKTARQKLNKLISSGALVFAETELIASKSALSLYEQSLRDGLADSSILRGEKFIQSIASLDKAVASRRVASIEAKLVRKSGEVDKRKGLLGEWKSAEQGNLFAESDGLRTGKQSTAQMGFLDGSLIVVNENTTAAVRASKLDKLDNSVRTDVGLIRGSLIAQLSKQTQTSGAFRLNTPSSETVVRSGKFWASSGAQSDSRLSNYDGSLEVRSGKEVVTVQKNQGTVALRNKPPLAPVDLLPAPRLFWSGLDTVIYQNPLRLSWTGIAGSTMYAVEVSDRQGFDANVQRFTVKKEELPLPKFPTPVVYLRLYAMDKFQLRGIESPVYRILQNPDREAPPIYLDGFLQGNTGRQNDTLIGYTLRNEFALSGETELDAALTIRSSSADTRAVILDASGRFSTTVKLTDEINFVSLQSVDRAGNFLRRTVKLVQMNPTKLADVIWNVKAVTDTIYGSSLPIYARGASYPNVAIRVTHADESIAVQTDTQGNWGFSFTPKRNQPLMIRFVPLDDSLNTVQKIYFVK
jgi:hypothetical protein